MDRTDPTPDPAAIRGAYEWLAPPAGSVIEARAIDLRTQGGAVRTAFFDDPDAFVAGCAAINAQGFNVYAGLNPRPERFMALAPNQFRYVAQTARAADLERVRSAMLDIDPKRARNTASTDAELAQAVAAGQVVAADLEARGWARPTIVMSGNGVQLWLAIPEISLTDESRRAVPAGLQRLQREASAMVARYEVKVDVVHTLEHLAKIAGTCSRKGAATPDRPYRRSTVIGDRSRREDPALRAYLLATPPAAPVVRHLPILAAPWTEGRSALPTVGPDDDPDALPVALCSPARQLWDQGLADRSVAIFDLVRVFAHKGLGLDDITRLLLPWDRSAGRKLADRDGAAYVRQAYEKVMASAGPDGGVAPPCRSLRELGYCPVDDVRVPCEVASPVVDVAGAVALVPDGLGPVALPYRLAPIFEAVVLQPEARRPELLARITDRFPMDEEAVVTEIAEAEARVTLRRRELAAALEQAVTPPSAERPRTDLASSATPHQQRAATRLEGEIYESGATYEADQGKHRITVSSFVLEPVRWVETDGGTLFVCTARTDGGRVISDLRLPRVAFNSRRELLAHLKSPDLQWTGSDNHAQGLLRRLSKADVPVQQGTTMLGTHIVDGRPVFVFPGGAIDAGGFTTGAPLEFVPSGSAVEATVRFEITDDETYRRIAATVGGALPCVNVPAVATALLGWIFAAPMKPFCMRACGAFPILSIVGSGGAGKTSIVSGVLLPITGMTESEPHGAAKTSFTLLRALSATTSMPVFLDEYKPSEMSEASLDTLHRLLKIGYKGGVEERGHANQTVTRYVLQAPVILAGETRPTDAPLLERLVTATPAKGSVEVPAFRQAYKTLVDAPLHLFSPRYLQWCMGRDLHTDLARAGARVAEILGARALPTRLVTNLTVMALGVELFDGFMAAQGVDRNPAVDLSAAVEAVIADVTGGAERPRNGLDQLLELLPVLVSERRLAAGENFAVRDGLLHLHLDTAFSAYQQHLRRTGDPARPVDLAGLRRMARENESAGGYVVQCAGDNRVYLRPDHRRRVVSIDLSRAGDLVLAEDLVPTLGTESGATDDSIGASPGLWPALRGRA